MARFAISQTMLEEIQEEEYDIEVTKQLHARLLAQTRSFIKTTDPETIEAFVQ